MGSGMSASLVPWRLEMWVKRELDGKKKSNGKGKREEEENRDLQKQPIVSNAADCCETEWMEDAERVRSVGGKEEIGAKRPSPSEPDADLGWNATRVHHERSENRHAARLEAKRDGLKRRIERGIHK